MSQSVKREIVANWSFIHFAMQHGPKCQIAPFTNKQTGDTFKSLVLTDNRGNQTLVNFSSKMGELTGAELVKQKLNLQVLQFPDTTDEATGEVKHHFCLCRQGSTWEDVDLGL